MEGNPLVQPFNVYTVRDGEQNKHFGGAATASDAVLIATAVFVAAQGQGSEIPLVMVYDSTDAVIAFVGDTGKVVA